MYYLGYRPKTLKNSALWLLFFFNANVSLHKPP